MKKFILLFLLFLMFIPFVVNAETCDTDKITIENIAIESKSDNVEELNEATVSGKSINLDLSMSDVGDYIEYELVVKNDSNEDYELDKTSLNLNSDYINYSFETEDNSNIVKAKSSKNVSLRVEYKTEVPEDKFESGSFSDNKTMTVQLSNGNTINVPDTIKNPKTGAQSYILIILIILLVSGSLYILLKKKKYTKFMILIIGTAMIIPISVYALCKCEIKIDSKVKIENLSKYSVYITNAFGHNTKENLDTKFSNYIIHSNDTFEIDGETYLDYDYGVINVGKYKVGQKVYIENLKLGKLCPFWTTHHYSDGIYVSTCDDLTEVYDIFLDDNAIIYCDTEEECNAEDFEDLEFSSYHEEGSPGYTFKNIDFPVEFIMPNHDVYLVIDSG